MRKDELRAPNPSCAAQLFAADAFGRRPSASSASAVRLRSVLGDRQRRAVRAAFQRALVCLLLHLYCRQRSSLLPHFITRTHGTVVF